MVIDNDARQLSGNNFLIRNLPGYLSDKLLMPFTILNFEKKIINLVAKAEFKKNSFINLGFYTIEKIVRLSPSKKDDVIFDMVLKPIWDTISKKK